MQHCLLLIIVAMPLAGCSALPHLRGAGLVPAGDGGDGVNHWLHELHATRAMPPQMLEHTLHDWEQAFGADPTVSHRMRLALLLASGAEPTGDRQRARQLLEGFDAGAGGVSEQQLAGILQRYLEERQHSRGKISNLRKQVAGQRRRIAELEQQLQALTTIEQHIQQRDKGAGD